MEAEIDQVSHYHYLLTVGYHSSLRDAERYLEIARTSLNRIARDIGARPEILIFGARDWMVERFAKLSERTPCSMKQEIWSGEGPNSL